MLQCIVVRVLERGFNHHNEAIGKDGEIGRCKQQVFDLWINSDGITIYSTFCFE